MSTSQPYDVTVGPDGSINVTSDEAARLGLRPGESLRLLAGSMAEAAPEPFAVALRRMMDERGVTFRRLARLTKELDNRGQGLSAGYLGALAREHDERPSTRAMALIAQALQAEPQTFVEYRLSRARALLMSTRSAWIRPWRTSVRSHPRSRMLSCARISKFRLQGRSRRPARKECAMTRRRGHLAAGACS